MAQNNNSQSRQQTTPYTSPHSYPSPPMQPAYAYPPPNGQQPGEPYRDSPPGATHALPSINHLASLRAHESDRRPTHDPMNPMINPGLPPAMTPGTTYYPPPAAPYNGMGMPMTDSLTQQGMSARYSMSSPAGSMISGGRNKKEIKRRTKTGCLTCRKRRIKCDEEHPVCRNCQKSKRECLGYDPVFKQQQHQSTSPAPIQPALGSGDGVSPITTSVETPTSTYSSVPQGYAPASINSPSPSVSQTYDYNSAIDPALAGSDSAALTSANAFDGGHSFSSEVKGEIENGSPYTTTTAGATETKPKRTLKIDDLFMMGDDPPTPAPSKEIPPEMYHEIKELYSKEYAKGIDAFLETTWYSTKGTHYLLKDIRTCELFQSYVEHLQKVKCEDYDDMRKMPGHEARVVWSLMCLTRFAANKASLEDSSPPYDEQLNEVTRRLAIFENLITGHAMPMNPLAHTQPHQGAQRDSKYYRTEFWRLLGKFVSLQISESNELQQTLGSLRFILRQHENRDVLYSIAIVRHFGANDQDHGHVVEQDRQKVAVAKTFIENEAAGQGTSQVIQRLCGMAARSWMAIR